MKKLYSPKTCLKMAGGGGCISHIPPDPPVDLIQLRLVAASFQSHRAPPKYIRVYIQRDGLKAPLSAVLQSTVCDRVKNWKMPSTLEKKYRATGPTVQTVKSTDGTGTKKVPRCICTRYCAPLDLTM